MSSWLNFNDSLNSLKGQISNFANNVLAEDEAEGSYEELKRICVRQELEIKELQKLNEELQNRNINHDGQNHIKSSRDNWEWTSESNVQLEPTSQDAIANLEKQIAKLENEKKELVNQLEQLDADNQQNISEIVAIKDKLQEENAEITDKCDQLMQQTRKMVARETQLKKELEEVKLQSCNNVKKTKEHEKYQVILEENQNLKVEVEECKKKINSLKSSNTTMQNILENLKEEDDNTSHSETIKQLQAENKILYGELQKAKQNMAEFEKKSVEDDENCKKLAIILDTYEKQVSSLKEELSNLKTANKDQENQSYKEELEKLKVTHKKILEDKEQVHNKYVNIITENVKRYIDGDKMSEDNSMEEETDAHIKDFSKQVENILKILLDFKCKCENLEKEVFELTQEKTVLITEKNHEIEKLIQNSEILSQEVITKTQELKEYEQECNELVKNNELLINELDTFKDNSGLQTISESNEDNLLLLETQLENANKRIEDLERIVDEYEQTKPSDSDALNLEAAMKRIEDLEKIIHDMEIEKDKNITKSDGQLENVLRKLQISNSEVDNKSKEYQILLNKYDGILLENKNLKEDLKRLEQELNQRNREHEELKLTLQKMRLDFEDDKQQLKHELEIENQQLKSALSQLRLDYDNADYQLTELNINIDTLKEELEVCKEKNNNLLKENSKLTMINNEAEKNNEDVRTELNSVKEKLLTEEDARRQLEVQVRSYTEKLNNAKVSETTLKVQIDAINKELMSVNEVKRNLEIILANTNTQLEELKYNYAESQTGNQALQETVRKYENELIEKENFVKELQDKCSKYENLAVENNKELLKTLKIADESEKNNLMEVDLDSKQSEDIPLIETLELEDTNDIKCQLKAATEEKVKLEIQVSHLLEVQHQYIALLQKSSILEKQLEELNASRNELINIVTTKHQESITYHSEIQRLTQILSVETEKCGNLEAQLQLLSDNNVNREEWEKLKMENEKLLDKNNFLTQKCDVVMKNLLEEQAKLQNVLAEKPNSSEKEQALSKELERLKTHLLEVEETLTQELLEAEQKNATLQAKVNAIEQREKDSSTMYTSISIRANQQVEVLQNQVQTLTNQREELRKKISDGEDLNNKQGAALANLQFVLEQFQKDKEKDVQQETERIRRQIKNEKLVQEELRREISNLKQQLDDSKQGLQAASRLSDQLEYSKRLVVNLKDEVNQLQDKLAKTEERVKNLSSQTDGKVEKSLIKNLVIGYVSSNNNMNKDQSQILKIIATVLDFNQQDHDKVNSSKGQQSSWLSSFLTPQPGQSLTQESLSQAFVKFLENESKPRVVPSLLNSPNASESTKSQESSKSSSKRQSPIVLNEIVLPTFADFAQNRNSSSILKDVLKDSSSNNS